MPDKRRLSSSLTLAVALGFGIGLAQGMQHPRTVDAAGQAGTWQAAMGDFAQLGDLLVLADDEIWAAGDGVVRYDGSAWRQVLDGQRYQFHAIGGLSSDAIWVAGEVIDGGCHRLGMLFGWDGQRWQAHRPGHHAPIYDLEMVAPDEGWAVGGFDRAVILRYDGQGWQAEDAPDIATLRALDVVAPDDVWAVGDAGAVAHFDGRAWEAVEAPPYAWLRGLHMRPDGGWAVGFDRSSQTGVALVHRAGRWAVDMVAETPALAAVHGIASDDALAVGQHGAILRRDGAGWREIGRSNPGGFVPWFEPRPGQPSRAEASLPGPIEAPLGGGGGEVTGLSLLALEALPGGDGLIAVGDHGQVVRIDDALQWSVEFAARQLQAIDMLSAEEGWVVGQQGPPMHWRDGAWRPAPAPASARLLRHVVTLAPDAAWAAGERGIVMRWDGTAWQQLEPFTWYDITHIDFSSPQQGWAVVYEATLWEGGSSEIPATRIYRWDGQAWTQVLRLCDVRLTDVLALEDGSAWFASSSRDALLRFDGKAFSWHPIWGWDQPDGRHAIVETLLKSPDGGVYGSGFGVARLEDGRWRSIGRPPSPQGGYPYPYYSYPARAIGADGRLWGLRGNTAYQLRPDAGTLVLPAARIQLADLDLVHLDSGDQELWAVGASGSLLRYRIPDSGPVPEATATALLPALRTEPTPTPYSVIERAAARQRVLELADPAPLGGSRLESLELMSEAGYRLHGQSEWLSYWQGNFFSRQIGDLYDCEADGSRAIWLARFSASPICEAHLDVAIAGWGDEAYELRCYPRKVAELHLPLLVQYRPREGEPATPTPTVTPRSRQLTPEPVESILGPCPTRTPRPTSVYPGYPAPATDDR